MSIFSSFDRLIPRARWLLALALALVGAVAANASEQAELRVQGMTFVGSRGSNSELVLHARYAVFHPEDSKAHLDAVHAVVNSEDAGTSFDMTCDRAHFDIETNDFKAEGNVRGTTDEGQHYSTPWVEYDHERGILHTSAPVVMTDATGTFKGDGFEYDVDRRRFKLLGNVRVEQNQ